MLHNNISSIGFIKNTPLAWQPRTVINGHQSPGSIHHCTDCGSIQLLLRCQMKAGAQTNSTTDTVLCAKQRHRKGKPSRPPAPCPAAPMPGLPGSTCLQESSAGGAQEHHGVVIDAGHRHRCQAAVGEDGGRCDGVHNGQRVLKVCCSTVQLLRLQLRRDTHVNGLWQTPAGPPHHHRPGLREDKLLMAPLRPGKAPRYRVMEWENVTGLIWEQRTVKSLLCACQIYPLRQTQGRLCWR